jgi:hypothetical protein
MELGSRSPQIFEPGTPGATANLWAAMIRVDKFAWELYLADNHAKKIHVSGSRHFDGNWLFAYVPVTPAGEQGKRVWMMSKLKDDDHANVEKKLTAAEQKDYDEETARINENKKKPEAAKPHEFKPARWTHKNGHPRCLVCGADEPTGRVCNMPHEWYEKFEWDDEKAWAEERKRLRGEKIIKVISKSLEIFISKEDEHIVGGIVYEPDIVDGQGDWASEEDIQEAAYYFMENSQQFKVRHKGEPNSLIKILESYIVPAGFRIDGKLVKKGSWYLTLRILDEEVWREVKEGKLTGFSLAGTAEEA